MPPGHQCSPALWRRPLFVFAHDGCHIQIQMYGLTCFYHWELSQDQALWALWLQMVFWGACSLQLLLISNEVSCPLVAMKSSSLSWFVSLWWHVTAGSLGVWSVAASLNKNLSIQICLQICLTHSHLSGEPRIVFSLRIWFGLQIQRAHGKEDMATGRTGTIGRTGGWGEITPTPRKLRVVRNWGRAVKAHSQWPTSPN